MAYHFVVVKTESEKEKTRLLLESLHLSMDNHVSSTYNLYDDHEMIGTISTHENVIKMIGVVPNRQGEQLTSILLQHVIRHFEELQINKYFLFTKPENKHLFMGYPFSLVYETDQFVLFENKLYPISDHLLSLKLTLKPKLLFHHA